MNDIELRLTELAKKAADILSDALYEIGADVGSKVSAKWLPFGEFDFIVELDVTIGEGDMLEIDLRKVPVNTNAKVDGNEP